MSLNALNKHDIFTIAKVAKNTQRTFARFLKSDKCMKNCIA